MEILTNTFEDHLQGLYFVSLIAFLTFWVAHRNGFFVFPLPERDTFVHFVQVIGAFFIFLTLMLVVAPVIFILLTSIWKGHLIDPQKTALDTSQEGWLNIFSIAMSSFGIILYTSLLSKKTQNSIWGTSNDTFHNLIMGAITWFVAFPLVALISQIIGLIILSLGIPSGLNDQVAVRFLKTVSSHPLPFVIVALLIVTLVPIVEELLFRGFLQNWLRKHFGVHKAILISSLIFTFFHFSYSQGWDNIEFLTSLFTLSCFLGYIYERQQSLWSSITLHATFNAISVLMLMSK